MSREELWPLLQLPEGYPGLIETESVLVHHAAYMPVEEVISTDAFSQKKLSRSLYGLHATYVALTHRNPHQKSCSAPFIRQVQQLVEKMRTVSALAIFFDQSRYAHDTRRSERTTFVGQFQLSLKDRGDGLYPNAPNSQLELIKSILERLYYFFTELHHKESAKKVEKIKRMLSDVAVCGPGSFEKLCEIDRDLFQNETASLNIWLADLRENCMQMTASKMVWDRKESLTAYFKQKYPRDNVEAIREKVRGVEIHMQSQLRYKANAEWGLYLPGKNKGFSDAFIHYFELSETDYIEGFNYFRKTYASLAIQRVFNELRSALLSAFEKVKAKPEDSTISDDSFLLFEKALESLLSDFDLSPLYFLKIDDEGTSATLVLDEFVLMGAVLSTFVSRQLISEDSYLALEEGKYLFRSNGKSFFYDKKKAAFEGFFQLNEATKMISVIDAFTPKDLSCIAKANQPWIIEAYRALPRPSRITRVSLNRLSFSPFILMRLYHHFIDERKELVNRKLHAYLASPDVDPLIVVQVLLFFKQYNLVYFKKSCSVENFDPRYVVSLFKACDTVSDIECLASACPTFISVLSNDAFRLQLSEPIKNKLGLLRASTSANVQSFLSMNQYAQRLMFREKLQAALDHTESLEVLLGLIDHPLFFDVFEKLFDTEKRAFFSTYREMMHANMHKPMIKKLIDEYMSSIFEWMNIQSSIAFESFFLAYADMTDFSVSYVKFKTAFEKLFPYLVIRFPIQTMLRFVSHLYQCTMDYQDISDLLVLHLITLDLVNDKTIAAILPLRLLELWIDKRQSIKKNIELEAMSIMAGDRRDLTEFFIEKLLNYAVLQKADCAKVVCFALANNDNIHFECWLRLADVTIVCSDDEALFMAKHQKVMITRHALHLYAIYLHFFEIPHFEPRSRGERLSIEDKQRLMNSLHPHLSNPIFKHKDSERISFAGTYSSKKTMAKAQTPRAKYPCFLNQGQPFNLFYLKNYLAEELRRIGCSWGANLYAKIIHASSVDECVALIENQLNRGSKAEVRSNLFLSLDANANKILRNCLKRIAMLRQQAASASDDSSNSARRGVRFH